LNIIRSNLGRPVDLLPLPPALGGDNAVLVGVTDTKETFSAGAAFVVKVVALVLLCEDFAPALLLTLLVRKGYMDRGS